MLNNFYMILVSSLHDECHKNAVQCVFITHFVH